MKRPIINSAEDSITELAVSGSFVSIVPSGSILCVVRSGILAHTFPVAVNSVAAAINQDMRALHPFPGVLARYVFYYLKFAQSDVLGTCRKHGTTVASIESSRLDDFPVPVCDERRQCGIVEAVDRLFAEIDDGEAALSRARANLEVYRRALLKAAVTGELTADWRAANPARETGAELLARILADRRARWHAEPKNKGKRYVEPVPPITKDLADLPRGWTWASLQQLAYISGGVTVDGKRISREPKEVSYLRVANVQRGWLDLREVKRIIVDASVVDGLTLQQGDMLLNEGGDRDKVGRGWIFEGQLRECLHQNHVFKARPGTSLIEPRLVMTYLNEFGKRFFFDQGKQTTNLASISMTRLSAVPVPCPPDQEAALILEKLADASFERPKDAATLDELKVAGVTLRQSILAAAFRGDLT